MVEMKSNIKEILAAWKEKPRKMENAMEEGLANGLRKFEGQRIIRGMLSGRKSPNYGLNTITGNARNSWNTTTRREGTDIVGRISSDPRAWYLKVHQHYNFNGYIRPRNAQLLTIPIHPDAKGKRTSDFTDLVFIKPVGKAPMLVRNVKRKSGKISRSDIMFLLRPQVYVPKRLYIFEEFNTIGIQMVKSSIMERLTNAAKN